MLTPPKRHHSMRHSFVFRRACRNVGLFWGTENPLDPLSLGRKEPRASVDAMDKVQEAGHQGAEALDSVAGQSQCLQTCKHLMNHGGLPV